MITRQNKLFLAPVLLTFSFNTWSADIPDAGRILREQPTKPPQIYRPPSVTIPDESVEKSVEKAGPSLLVEGLRLEGATLISEVELQAELVSVIGQELSFGELQKLTNTLTAYYASKGYLAQAILPPQDVEAGVVTIKIIEGMLGKVTISNQGERVQSERVKGFIDHRLVSGDPMDLSLLGESLKILNDQPGVAVSSSLDSGSAEGAVNVLVTSNDKPLFSHSLSVSNQGSRATGEMQTVLSGSWYNPTGHFDAGTVQFTRTKGSRFWSGDYSLAAGYSGLRVGANVSTLEYKVTQDTLKASGSEGEADTFGVNAFYPVYRRNEYSLGVSGNLTRKILKDYTIAGEVGDRDITVASVSLNGSRQDDLGEGGVTSFSLGFTYGDSDQHNASASLQDDATREAFDTFSKISYSLGRQQQLAPLWVLDVNLNGQHAFDNLDSSERFSLGGATGVRAYPTGEGGGDEGSLLSLNLTNQLSDNLFGTLFVDTGYVRNNHDTWAGWNAADPSQKNSYVLSGFGAALSWSFQNEVSVSATLAAPIGNNPGRDANDNDSDGRSQNVRGWLSLVAQF